MKSYEGLYAQVHKDIVAEVKKYLRQYPATLGQSIIGVLENSDRDMGTIINSLSSVFGRKADLDRVTDIVEDISELLGYAVKGRIISGFEVTAEDPPSGNVVVASGRGVIGSGICETEASQVLPIPLWDTGRSVWYVTIETLAGLSIDTGETDTKLTLANKPYKIRSCLFKI